MAVMSLLLTVGLMSQLSGRRVTVPQVNACFVDGTADWTVVEANVTALLGECDCHIVT
jgi:hypothetical protein